MSRLVLETPVKLRLPPEWAGSSVEKKLRDELGYEDRSVTMEWRRFKEMQRDDDRRLNASGGYKPAWWVLQNGREALDKKVEELDSQRYKKALFSDAAGLYTYSGLAYRLCKEYGVPVERNYRLPAPQVIKCDRPLRDPRYYQSDGVARMVEAAHAGVELPTGSGKSLMIAMLCRHFGLPAVVATPTLSIATQLYNDLAEVFGKKRVGKFFDSKKESGKQFVVACTKSLVRVEPGSDTWEQLQRPVLIFDESHITPAETLAKTVLKLLAGSPYRFFLSGTQLRGDGRDIVLEGITGDIVLEIPLQRLVQEGFLARPQFVQYMTTSSAANPFAADALKLGRVHFYRNDKIYRHAGDLLTKAARAGRRPLVLMQEVEQFKRLLPHLKEGVGFAYGGADAKQKKLLPEKFHKSDPEELVAAFDRGELPVLAGTQSIGVGTDIKSANFVVDLVNDGSETRFRQNVGRGTRTHGGKSKFWYVSYGISNVPVLSRQAEKRQKIMESIYPPVTVQEF